MIWLAAIGGGSFVLVSLVLGPRLLFLGRSRRELPEFTMGLCLLLMGGLGYPFATLGRVVTALPDDLRGLFLGCSALCNTVGFGALAIFTWRVFRPRSGFAEAMMALCMAALALLVPAEAVWPGLVESALSKEPYPGAPGYLRVVVGLGILYWSTLEAGRFARQLGRRLAIGLGDPVVADRVRLWTIAMAGASISYTESFLLSFAGIDLPAAPMGAMTIGILGLLSAASAWLAFLPPAAYLRWVAARAHTVSASASQPGQSPNRA
jgi:hypothetical protein